MAKQEASKTVPFKTCIVPTCSSNTTRTPEKVFLHVPYEQEIRKKWCKAVGRAPEKTRGNCYCCEDHFDLEDDIANYHIFKQIGGRKRIKPGVIPHKNLPPNLNAQSDSDFDEIIHEFKKQKLDDGEVNLPPAQPVVQTTCTSDEHAQDVFAVLLGGKQVDVGVLEPTDFEVETMNEDALTKVAQENSSVDADKSCVVHIISPPNMNLCTESAARFCRTVDKKHAFVQTDTVKNHCAGIMCKPKVKNASTQVQEKYLRIDKQHKMTSTGVQTDRNVRLSESLASCKCLNKLENEDVLNTSVDTVESLCTDSSVYQPTSESATHTSEKETKLELLQENVYENVTKLVIENDPLLFLGVPKSSVFVLHNVSKLTGIPFQNISLVLKKIRQNHVNATLAYDFGYSDRHVARIFESTVPILAQVLKKLIFWASRDTIVKNLPIAFRHRFKKVESIIDTLEVQIEKPGNALHQAATWSDYKNCNTMKYLISIDPSGTINFLSNGFSGRTTDTNLAQNCGYLEVLPPGCHILADRGFKNISAAIEMHHCKIIVPCSVKTGEKCSETDVKKSKAIASCRIHVERVIERIREFRFLNIHSCVDNKNIHLLDDIVIIVGALVNLQERVIKQ